MRWLYGEYPILSSLSIRVLYEEPMTPPQRNSDQMLILLVEDRDDDILLFRKALRYAGLTNPLFVVRDGVEACRYLAGVGKYSHHAEFPLPDLVVLDLKMPAMDGFELLAWIRENPALNALRVVILSSSGEAADIDEACGCGANAYLVKPSDFHEYVDLARELANHWFKAARAPQLERSSSAS